MDQLFRGGRHFSTSVQRDPLAQILHLRIPVAEEEILRPLPVHEEGAHADDAGNYPCQLSPTNAIIKTNVIHLLFPSAIYALLAACLYCMLLISVYILHRITMNCHVRRYCGCHFYNLSTLSLIGLDFLFSVSESYFYVFPFIHRSETSFNLSSPLHHNHCTPLIFLAGLLK